jgi:S-adenosyl-L-methionine hydrolase (adenosine-forming)
MQIITLTTDFGEQDYYVAALKGALLSKHRMLNFFDITHQIKDYNIVQAAYSLRYSYRHFPEGTIHIIAVNNFYTKEARYVVVKHRNHFFIGPDNGIFSLLFDEVPTERYFLNIDFQDINTYKRVYADAVVHIAEGKPFEEIGVFAESITQRFSIQPVTTETQIRGSVIHIDNYGNVVLNVTRDLWERYSYYRRFTIFYKRNEPINDLSVTYSDVAIGETLCLFNAANHLEIAINMGKAASMLSMEIEDTVYIEFY